ncbi:Maintenance of ploidy protein mob2 [Malassezia vespertilionis]|nr:Maintenance of ploidy protein mob2 [Malassezia vespertilionis]WFD04714.1 Maintenance of ploidy protein mob2 [Malassezia vespertilionis]
MGRSTRLKSKGMGMPSYEAQMDLRDDPRMQSGEPKPLYLCQPFVRSTLIKGSFKTIVALPKYVHPYEWIAVNLFDFFHNLNLFCAVIAESCTPQKCSTMSAGVGLDYTWVDVNRKPIHLPAPQYIDYVMTWIGQLLDDEAVFPTKSGRDFPPAFLSVARQMYMQMLRIFAHIYHAHFPLLLHVQCECHFNSLFAHFIAFGKEFGLFNFRLFKSGGIAALDEVSMQGPLIAPNGDYVPYPGVCDLMERWVYRGILPKEVLL